MHSLKDRQRAPIKLLGFFVFPLTIENGCQRGCVGGDVGVIRPKRILTNLDRPAGERLTSGVTSTGMLEST